MDDVKCLGDEKALGYCSFSDWGKYSSNCDHEEDVSLDCVVKAEGKIVFVGAKYRFYEYFSQYSYCT